MSQAQRRHLQDVFARLFGPLLEAGRLAGWRLLDWDAEQGLCLTFVREDEVVLVELERHDPQMPCYARTGRFNICARRQFVSPGDLLPEQRELIAQLLELVRRREGLLPEFERPTTGRRVAVRQVEVDRVLVAEGRNHYYINPYVGCTIGCSFCYVIDRADFSRALEGLPRLPWGRYLDVKVNAAEVLARQVDGLPPGVVRFSPIVTDPYQPAERKWGITRACLEVLQAAGWSVVVLTRAGLVLRDLDLLRRFERVAVGFSIPTDDERVRRIFEPGADTIAARLQALQRLRRAGIPTVAVIQPMLPMNPRRLAGMLAGLVDVVRVDRMYAGHLTRELCREHHLEHEFADQLQQRRRRELLRELASHGIELHELDDLQHLLTGLTTRV